MDCIVSSIADASIAKKRDFSDHEKSMFDNFIYYIIALLIYSTYKPSEETNFNGFETAFLFLGLLCVFAWFSRIQFSKIEKRIPTFSFSTLDNKFSTALTRQSIMAIAIFAIDIYGLNLTSFFLDISLFSIVPSIQALLFLCLFTGYLSIVWTFSYPTYRKLYPTEISKKSYVFSKITISIPVILPWFLLSGTVDLINALPFEALKRFLSSPQGEVIYFLVFLIGVSITGPAMIQKFWRCKPLEIGFARSRIEALCQRAGLKFANILYWPIFGGKIITAGVMGLIKNFRYILVTRALFRFLDPDEIDAVIAHEIGHVKKKHLLFYLVFFIGYLLLAYTIFDMVIMAIFYAEPIYQFINSEHVNQITATSVITSLLMILIFLFYFRFIFGYFMRNFERQADLYVYELFDSAKPLIRTLEKIAYSSGQAPDKPNWHHFSISQRIAYLENCETDKTWINRHGRKIKKSISAYLVGLFLIAGIGYHLNFGESNRKISIHFLEKVILRQIEKTPDNPHLFRILGDLYFSRNNYEGTVIAYTKAIDLSPENPHALNNLAWLYATCDDPRFHNPEKAVALAEQAVRISRAPHILDTLAESYYASRMYTKAIQVEMDALNMDKKNRSYYLKQIEKFKDADRLHN